MPPSTRERIWFSASVNVIGGLLVGYCIGYVPVALTIHDYVGNCTRYEAEAPCVKETNLCVWRHKYDSAELYCDFKDAPAVTVNTPYGCRSINSSDTCKNTHTCMWVSAANSCVGQKEWSAWETGLYAGMMIVGGMVGSFSATTILARAGRKPTIALTGLIGVIAVVLEIVGWQINTSDEVGLYWLMVAGRLIAGLAVGLASVACPMYCGEMAPPEWASVIGCTFQVAVTFGIFLVALIGYIIGLTIHPAKVIHLQSRFHAINAVNLLFPVLLIPLSGIVQNPPLDTLPNVTTNTGEPGNENDNEAAGLLDDKYEVPLSRLKRNFIVAVALAAAQQLTGINAVMNYAPQITANFGMKPLLGNMVVMLWNFVTTIASIPIARRLSVGQMYVGGAIIASLACLLTAIPVFPTVFPPGDKTGYALTGVGIFVFVAAFEMGMGPAFYVLSQSIFPASRRSLGCSFTIVVQFIFNLIINFCYPVAVEGLSGGENEDQRTGMGWVFVIFGVVGLVCTFTLGVNLYISKKEEEAEKEPEYGTAFD